MQESKNRPHNMPLKPLSPPLRPFDFLTLWNSPQPLLNYRRLPSYPEWNQEGPKMRTLAVGIESVLSKSFAFAGGGEGRLVSRTENYKSLGTKRVYSRSIPLRPSLSLISADSTRTMSERLRSFRTFALVVCYHRIRAEVCPCEARACNGCRG